MKQTILGVLLAVALATPAQAQSVKMQVGPGGMSVDVDDEGPGAQVRMDVDTDSASVSMHQTEERSEDGYKVRYESHPQGKTLIKVLEPEGAHIEIWEGSRKLVGDDIPVSVSARGDTFYRFVIRAGELTWEKKLAAKAGMTMSLQVAAPGPAPAPVTEIVVRHERPMPSRAGGSMSDADFDSLKEAIEAEGFGDDKLSVLRTAASRAWFTCAQVGELIDLFSFSEEKLGALNLVKDHIVDRNNTFKVFSHFSFSEDKEKAEAMLR